MLPIKAWRIYYADFSTFSSDDGFLAEAPPFGLCCKVYYSTDGTTLYRNLDSGGNEGIFYVDGEGDLEGVKMGMWMDGEGCYRIHEMARNDEPPRFLPEVE